jgi:hypothetical protein
LSINWELEGLKAGQHNAEIQGPVLFHRNAEGHFTLRTPWRIATEHLALSANAIKRLGLELRETISENATCNRQVAGAMRFNGSVAELVPGIDGLLKSDSRANQ